jgi:hypothetical protein
MIFAEPADRARELEADLISHPPRSPKSRFVMAIEHLGTPARTIASATGLGWTIAWSAGRGSPARVPRRST